jgi:hypothetical protein
VLWYNLSVRKALGWVLACCLMAAVWPSGAPRAAGLRQPGHAADCGMACCKRGAPGASCAAGWRCGGDRTADFAPAPLPPSVLPRMAALPLPSYLGSARPAPSGLPVAFVADTPDRPPRRA